MRDEAYIQELKSLIEQDAKPERNSFGKKAVYYTFYALFTGLFTYFVITVW